MTLLLALVIAACGTKNNSAGNEEEPDYDYPDTLRVGTLYGPMSYFEYRDETMGYDYALATQLAADKNREIEFVVAPSLAEAVAMLDSGRIDVIAYDVPVTAEYLETVTPCAYEHQSSQVIVQKKGPGKLTDVTELIGKDIYVEKDSKFFYRLGNLNEELGGGINILTIDEDSLISVDLLQKVSDGEMAYTVVDSETARLNRPYYPDLDVSLQISFPQRSSWAVANSRKWLADSINAWFAEAEPQKANRLLLRRYFELSRVNRFDVGSFTRNFKKGHISQYDDLFKKYALQEGLDWRLLAAISYAESKFDNTVVSWAGARGIMQIMPSAARAFRVDPSALTDPATSVELAARMITSLDKSLQADVPDPAERQKFILAAYNGGIAHIKDALSIAKAIGYDSTKWDGNVAEALRMKSQPEIYNNKEICRYGYFKGNYTTAYVRNVTDLYDRALKAFPAK